MLAIVRDNTTRPSAQIDDYKKNDDEPQVSSKQGHTILMWVWAWQMSCSARLHSHYRMVPGVGLG
jgi:hypothetical protein